MFSRFSGEALARDGKEGWSELNKLKLIESTAKVRSGKVSHPDAGLIT